MDHIEIPGARVPRLGLGTWQLAGDECRRVVAEAIELGYRHIDTAQMYRNEAEVGAAVMDSGVPREEFFLTTKIWKDSLTHARALATFDQSLEKLGTGYVDLLLIHWPNPAVPLRETMLALEEIRREGRARHLGVSNFGAGLLEEARAFAPVINDQVEYHLFHHQDEVCTLARRHEDLFVTAYCPLARGRVAEQETVRAIAEEVGRTPAQVALRWLVQQPRVAAIPKASSREHLAANLAVCDFELSPGQVRRLDAVATGERCVDPAQV